MEVIIGTIAGASALVGLKKVFDRAPKRKIPESGIVSPASGKVIEIVDIDPTKFEFVKKKIKNTVSLPELGTKAKMIVIEMNIRDVHVQRAPIEGVVIYSKHFSGKHKNVIHNKGKKDSVYINEKQITVIKGKDFSTCVIQVAGFVARRIRSRVHINQFVKKGAVIGKISFGSQTILILPNTLNIKIRIGDRVTDGETLITQN